MASLTAPRMAPVGFLGMPALLSATYKSFGVMGLDLFTPLLALITVVALWRILRGRVTSGTHRHYAVGLSFLLLALNAAWSWMFFWAHSPLLGLVNIVPQLAVIVATIVVFAQLDGLAAICLVPLAAWVAFASALNITIWQLNG